MKIQDVRARAKEKGVKVAFGAKKADIIRAIQLSEGYFDCFGSAGSGYCDQPECLWKEDCFKASKQN